MLIVAWIVLLSVLCNGPIYAMIRYSNDPRNFIPAPEAWDIEIPDLTFDSRGMV